VNRIVFWVGALALLALAARPVRAESIAWAYDWSKSTDAIAGDAGNTGGVSFTSFKGVLAGDQSIHATTMAAFISASAVKPDTYSGEAYHMVLDLTDQASGQSGQLTFTGRLFGSVSVAGGAKLTNTFETPLTESLKLGANLYTVTIGPFFAPKAANGGSDGFIDASVRIGAAGPLPPPPPPLTDPDQPPPTGGHTPEPASLVLACAALPLVALLRRPRGRGPTPAPA
jgi:hypothetical protein